jgi:cysteine desulfurase/selenocysteine lyase
MKNIKTEDANKKDPNFKKDFPIFDNHPDLVYLDSGATSQRPKQVIGSLKNFYEKENANIHRGVYTLSEEATEKYNLARKKVADFLNADQKEIVFTRNTTESLNLLANTLKPLIQGGKDEILLSEMEHHSNLVPWQHFAKENNMKLKFIPLTENYELDYKKAKELISDKTAVLSVTHISNVLGTVNNIKELISSSRNSGAISIIDAAQSIQHVKIDVQELDCDFLVFSSHKMLGPTGIGILYGKKPHLDNMEPLFFGGGMISSVSYEESTWSDLPEKFEAGTQNIAESIALGAAIDYIEKIGFNKIQEHESDLTNYALKELGKLENIEIYNPGANKSSAIISFNLKGIHPHDVAEILNDNDIAIRAGHHCCMPLMKKLNLQGTCRASFSIYNNKEDIDKLVKGLKKCQEVFR